jgi:hypothetical protein
MAICIAGRRQIGELQRISKAGLSSHNVVDYVYIGKTVRVRRRHRVVGNGCRVGVDVGHDMEQGSILKIVSRVRAHDNNVVPAAVRIGEGCNVAEPKERQDGIVGLQNIAPNRKLIVAVVEDVIGRKQ